MNNWEYIYNSFQHVNEIPLVNNKEFPTMYQCDNEYSEVFRMAVKQKRERGVKEKITSNFLTLPLVCKRNEKEELREGGRKKQEATLRTC